MDVFILSTDQRWQVANDKSGHHELANRLAQHHRPLSVLEATGGLEIEVVTTLVAEKLLPVVIKPCQGRDFAKATGRQANTDTLDAEVLPFFAQAIRSLKAV